MYPLLYLFTYFIYFLAGFDLCCCLRSFSSHGAWASPCGGFSCSGAQALGTWASAVTASVLSSCASRASLLRGTWNFHGPGIDGVPALAGGFLPTLPPGKSCFIICVT